MCATSSGTDAVVPHEGSNLYYSLLWTEPARRARFLERLSLVRALATTLDDVHDRGVAERKVHWWHEELERLAAGTPRHPRTVACAESLGGVAAATPACLDVLSVAATTRYTPAASDAEQRARLERDHGARLALLAHALSGDADDLADPGVRHAGLAVGLGWHATLTRLPALLHRGFAVFSDERYARHGTTPAALARHVRRAATAGASGDGEAAAAVGAAAGIGGIPLVVESPGRREIVAECVAEADATLEATLRDAAYRRLYARAPLAPLARLAALQAKELRLWRTAAPDLLRERTSPTPLAMLFVAWRHRRGAR